MNIKSLVLLATVVMASGASVGAAQAATYDIPSTFAFFNSNSGITTIPNGTSDTINDPGNLPAASGYLSATFPIIGDFTASVLLTGASSANNRTNAGFEVSFAGGGVTNQYLDMNDYNGAPPLWAYSVTSPTPTQVGGTQLSGGYAETLSLNRTGDTVSLLFDGTVSFFSDQPRLSRGPYLLFDL
jgi:hypothetical protein